MLTEDQIQKIEKELNIRRASRFDGKCVFGLYEQGKGCGRPAVNWLFGDNMTREPDILNVCKYHADLFGLE